MEDLHLKFFWKGGKEREGERKSRDNDRLFDLFAFHNFINIINIKQI